MRKEYQKPNAESATYVTNVFIAASPDPAKSAGSHSTDEPNGMNSATWGNIWGNR